MLRGWSFGASEGWDDRHTSYGAALDLPVGGPWGIRSTAGRVEQLFLDQIHVKYTLDVTFATFEGRWRAFRTGSGFLAVLHAGPGFYHLREVSTFSYGPTHEVTSGSTTRLGVAAGAALEVPIVRRWCLVADGTYHRLTGKLPVDSLPVPSFGVVSVGVAWRY